MLRERRDRVGDVVDRHHVDRRAPARGQQRVGAGVEGAQRPVEDVERRRPAGGALAHDDARPRDRPRQRARAHERLRLVLGALVGVAERAGLAVVLVGGAAAVAGHVGGRHVGHALQAGNGAGEVEHPLRALDVDGARLLERQVEGDGRRAVDDAARRVRPARRGDRRGPGAARSGRRRSPRRGPSTGPARAPATARRRESASASSAARTRQWTSWPAASRRESTAMPTKPVAPVSRIGRSVTGTGSVLLVLVRRPRVACRMAGGHGQSARTHGARAGPVVERATRAHMPSQLWALPAREMLKRG